MEKKRKRSLSITVSKWLSGGLPFFWSISLKFPKEHTIFWPPNELERPNKSAARNEFHPQEPDNEAASNSFLRNSIHTIRQIIPGMASRTPAQFAQLPFSYQSHHWSPPCGQEEEVANIMPNGSKVNEGIKDYNLKASEMIWGLISCSILNSQENTGYSTFQMTQKCGNCLVYTAKKFATLSLTTWITRGQKMDYK